MAWNRVRRRAIRCHPRFFLPTLGGRPVSELTTGDVEMWLSELVPATDDFEERRRAQATTNRYFNVLRAILNSAFRKDPARVPTDGGLTCLMKKRVDE